MKARTKDVLSQWNDRKKFWKSIKKFHVIGLNMKAFRMNNDGRSNMFWLPCGIHIASYIITIKNDIRKFTS